MKLAILAAMALALAPITTNAQTAPAREFRIVVVGSATVTRPAEWVTLSMTVRGEGATQVAAIKALEATRARIEANIRRMPGIDGLTFTADSLSVQDVRGHSAAATKGCSGPRAPVPSSARSPPWTWTYGSKRRPVPATSRHLRRNWAD